MEDHFHYIDCQVIVPVSGAEDTEVLVLQHSHPPASCLPPLCFATQNCVHVLRAALLLFPKEHCYSQPVGIFQSVLRGRTVLFSTKCYRSGQPCIMNWLDILIFIF